MKLSLLQGGYTQCLHCLFFQRWLFVTFEQRGSWGSESVSVDKEKLTLLLFTWVITSRLYDTARLPAWSLVICCCHNKTAKHILTYLHSLTANYTELCVLLRISLTLFCFILEYFQFRWKNYLVSGSFTSNIKHSFNVSLTDHCDALLAVLKGLLAYKQTDDVIFFTGNATSLSIIFLSLGKQINKWMLKQ